MAPAHAACGGGGLSLCLASGGVVKALSVAAFTLAWTHSIEKTAWQEDWQVTPAGLTLLQARIKGTGAGMEPPPEARLVDGWYVWHPADPQRREIVLRREPVAGDWTFCAPDVPCAPLGKLLPQDADPVTIKPCD